MTKHRKQKSSGRSQNMSAAQISNAILKQFAAFPRKRLNAKQLMDKLRLDVSRISIEQTLHRLETEGLIVFTGNDKYQWNKKNSIEATSQAYPTQKYIGRVDLTRTGDAYIIVDGEEQDIYVPGKFLASAMNKDIVKVEVPQIKSKRRPEGKVIEVVERALTHTVGTLRMFSQYGIVFPELANQFPEVLIKLKDVGKAEDGSRIRAEITSWGNQNSKSVWGKVAEILDKADPNEIAMQSILVSNGFDLEFPDEALKEAMMMEGRITSFEEGVRRDFRDILTFTIDPADAKDFDDAISYRWIEETDETEIGVHIADVTHFLKENTALDKEALKRSTSVYLVDRVLPMLPEKISNDLCSLNPNEDKYTFSAVFTFDRKFKITSRWFGKTIIHSQRRFTYEEAQERLETGEGDLADELGKVNAIANALRKERYKNGSINFESEEVRFKLDENKKPIGVVIKVQKEANRLIEDFMLLANKEVAWFMHKKSSPEIPFIYRVHDQPDMAKLTDFALFAKELGFQMKLDTPKNIAESFNRLAKEKEENELLKMLEPLAIRTMAKAAYSSNNVGHYGLAFEYYSHFTSPIRRYSDVLAHRILYQNLNEGFYRVDKEILESKCKHISSQERKAMDAERESVKYKQVEFMMDKVGQEFDAVISGMIEKGFFVEILESKAEGLIPFNQLSEHYVMHQNRLKAISKQTGHELKLGSQVRVKLEATDLSLRQLEFRLITETE